MKRAVFFALLIALLAFGSPARARPEAADADASADASEAQRVVVFEAFLDPG